MLSVIDIYKENATSDEKKTFLSDFVYFFFDLDISIFFFATVYFKTHTIKRRGGKNRRQSTEEKKFQDFKSRTKKKLRFERDAKKKNYIKFE